MWMIWFKYISISMYLLTPEILKVQRDSLLLLFVTAINKGFQQFLKMTSISYRKFNIKFIHCASIWSAKYTFKRRNSKNNLRVETYKRVPLS
jgi:hypothetical protein